MPTYIVEQYELHVQQYSVEAADKAAAILAVIGGEGTAVDNELEYVEPAEQYSQALHSLSDAELMKLANKGRLNAVGQVDTIRCVYED